ncbi:hypothetical protein AVEN_19925-1 [Araneus ventricosus]|uniref:Uncharacterized protein n=1 Tax=Araneus ventricosus TaxID=182803 RepID=A0A4Y2M5R7_ARAVE|nr:hypothetical protein AVEN_19925-1 [Araneus ventricosus]
MPPRSRVHFKMKKKELLSFTHSTLIHRLFRNSAVEKKTSSRFLDHSSLWFPKLHLSRNTNQEQKTSSASDSKNINGKIKAEARPQAQPAMGPAAGTTPTTRLARHKRKILKS